MDCSAEVVGRIEEHEREAVRALYREYRAYIESLYPFRPFEDEEIAALPGEIFVWRVAGVVAGCVALRRWGEGIAEIKRLYVAPAARGRQAGRRLMEHVLDVARRQGYGRVRLDTLEAMTAAVALYEALGFVEIGNYHGRELPWARFFERAL